MLTNKLSCVCYRIGLFSLKMLNNKEKALVLHHGMLGSARNLRPLCKGSVLNKYADLHLLDARNHGDSPHVDSHSVKELGDDLHQYLQKIRNQYKKITVLGHSMGGLAALSLTENHPSVQQFVERLIIVDIPCYTADRSWGQQGQHQMLVNVSKIGLDQPTSAIFKEIQQYAIDSDFANLLKFNVKILSHGKHRWRTNIPLIAKHYHEMTSYSLRESSWRGAVQVIYGGNSLYFEEEQVGHYLDLYPQMEGGENFHRVEDAGHWVHFDNKQKFIQIMQKILKRNE